MKLSCMVCMAALAVSAACAANLEVLPEHLRPDPFGGIVAADRATGGAAFSSELTLTTARGNYVSCHLVVKIPQGGDYTLRVEQTPGRAAISTELYREWFHFVTSAKAYYPDALIPVKAVHAARLPEPDNRIAKQTSQAYWLDLWVPFDAPAGEYVAQAALDSGGQTSRAKVRVRVLDATTPTGDAVVIDHNSYGTSWLGNYFPSLRDAGGKQFFASDSFFRLLHAYHRIFFEHRGILHQLGYGHGGKVGPEFAPALAGFGRTKRIASWDLYDRHYGPLLDGSAFSGLHRPAKPLPYVYLPINPEWPASFVNWGEPGYEAEFVNVVSAMERHFREKGWVNTRFEMFFNHKKRYKAFSWDGDETRFFEDYAFFREYRRLLDRAVPRGTPVKFLFRTDSSWTMERQFKDLAGVFDFWVCGGGMFSWYDYAPRLLKERGDTVWHYGGTPTIDQSSSTITLEPLRAWIWGIDGFVRWLTTSPGDDPWFHSDGGGTALVYPGERFGIAGPIASVRLKLERNAAADLAILEEWKKLRSAASLRAAAAMHFNRTTPAQWWTPRPAIADTPPQEWTNNDDVPDPHAKYFQKLDAAAWQNVRDYVHSLIKEGK